MEEKPWKEPRLSGGRVSLSVSVFSAASVLKFFSCNSARRADGRVPPLQPHNPVQKKNQGNKYGLKSEFALTGRGLRKYKKLYLKTVTGNLVHP
jgi:hypothetical protein